MRVILAIATDLVDGRRLCWAIDAQLGVSETHNLAWLIISKRI